MLATFPRCRHCALAVARVGGVHPPQSIRFNKSVRGNDVRFVEQHEWTHMNGPRRGTRPAGAEGAGDTADESDAGREEGNIDEGNASLRLVVVEAAALCLSEIVLFHPQQ